MTRNTALLPPIYVPAIENTVCAVHGQQAASPSNTPTTVGVSRLSIQSSSTPGATMTTYHEQPIAHTPGPTTAIFHGQALCPFRHMVTAWHGRFTFFNHFPPEIRERVYEYLVEDVVVIVNAISSRSVQVLKPHQLLIHPKTSAYVNRRYRQVLRSRSNFLCVSRQFFFEVRNVLWRCMVVKFERRWDFINASLKGTLIANASKATPSSTEALILFPMKTDVMSHVRELHLNLTWGTDFDGRVTTAEATRVTTSMLEVISQDMPLLKALFFIVDDRSRLSNSIIIFMPASWFLEALLAIKRLHIVSFDCGQGWQGHAQNKKNSRRCLYALNAVLEAHFAAQDPTLKLDADGITGPKLQARLGQRMLHYLNACPLYKETQDALITEVVILESNSSSE